MPLNPAAREIVSLIRRRRLTYDALRIATFQARRHLKMKPTKRARHLPQLLSDSDLRLYFEAISKGGNLRDEILIKLVLFTGIRVAELTQIEVSDVDLAANKIFIRSGKGDKDRYVLFPDQFRLVLKTYMAVNPENLYLFESRHKKQFTTRRIHQIITGYGETADLARTVHPHLLRHQCLTWLTKQGLNDSAIQLVSGHASKKSLEIYQHLSLKDVNAVYQDAMRKLDIGA